MRLKQSAKAVYEIANDIWDEDTSRFKVFSWFMAPLSAGNPVCTAARGVFAGASFAFLATGHPFVSLIFFIPLAGLITIEALDWHK